MCIHSSNLIYRRSGHLLSTPGQRCLPLVWGESILTHYHSFTVTICCSTNLRNKKGEIGNTVELALKEGYRLIDFAHIYRNEVEIGEALQKCFKEGVVKREDVFVTSKLWYLQ